MIGKWIGAALILFASWGLGCWLALRWKGRLRALEELRRMVYFLKGEITYGHAALDEAMLRVGKREGGALGQIFAQAAEEIAGRGGESLGEIWERAVERGKRSLACWKRRTGSSLKNWGEHLGYLDVDMQERTILLYLEQLDLSIEYLRLHSRERRRLYMSLGAAGGVFLVLILL